MRSREHAELLLRKAAEDQFVVEKLFSDPAAPDGVIGFHAQQSVEKTLKAALTLSSIHYGRTHSIAALIDLLAESRIVFPPELDQVRRLTPFAVVFRYDELPPQSSNRLTAPGLWIAFDRYEHGVNSFCVKKGEG